MGSGCAGAPIPVHMPRSVLLSPGQIAAAVAEHGLLPTPVNPDTRQPYAYFLETPMGEAFFADDIETLADALIPGHSTMDDSAAAEARIWYCAHAAAVLQADVISALTPDELNAIPADDMDTLLAPRLGPDAPAPTAWNSSIPLFVVETSYTPYTPLARPASVNDGVPGKPLNVIWLLPVEAEEMMLSLASAGFARLMRNVDREDLPF